MSKLSGELAYELFMSAEPFPLHSFLADWKAGKIEGEPGYVLAVIGAFSSMCDNSIDGRYDGVIRRRLV